MFVLVLATIVPKFVFFQQSEDILVGDRNFKGLNEGFDVVLRFSSGAGDSCRGLGL